jgi:actin-related protein 8
MLWEADLQNYSVIFIVPDYGDRSYIEAMTRLFLTEMDFKEIAIHQEASCAIFGAGLSSACVVDVGAQTTSVTFVDEGSITSDTR